MPKTENLYAAINRNAASRISLIIKTQTEDQNTAIPVAIIRLNSALQLRIIDNLKNSVLRSIGAKKIDATLSIP